MPREDFDGKLYKNAFSSNVLSFSYWYVGIPPTTYGLIKSELDILVFVNDSSELLVAVLFKT